jgi:hypothetical protein
MPPWALKNRMFRIGPKLKSPKINLSAYGDLTPTHLGDLQGRGLCMRTPGYNLKLSPYQNSCAQEVNLSDLGNALSFLVPPPGTWFADTMGITPCINSHACTGQNHEELCVLSHITPQVYLYEGEAGRQHLQIPPPFSNHRARRTAPILVPVLMGLGRDYSRIGCHRSFCIDNWRYKLQNPK